ncbi:MAG: sugar diacid recognition domain-containing protein [Cloacibacillus sp.]
MIFPKRSAIAIVHEISGIIGEQVNMMDVNGIIIASTDPDRINTFHGGAKRVVEEKLDELVVHRDGEYEGAKQGTNLPITFRDEIVGTIGVTGPYEKVEKYGQIIKKMTEILILDIAMSEQLNVESRARTRFLSEWIHGAQNEITPTMVNNGLRLFIIDITLPRRLMLISVIPNEAGADAATHQRTIDAVEKKIHDHLRYQDEANLVFRSDSYLVCLTTTVSDEKMLALADCLKKDTEKEAAVTLVIGIDAAAPNYQQIGAAFTRAQKALATCLRSPSRQPRLYASLNMEIFASELSEMTKREYIRRIFRGCSTEQIAEYTAQLEVYYECEGSITKAAEKLLIHKNTLQYRLKKLAEQTGYDPRSIKFSSLYYNAIHFYRDIEKTL